MHSLVGDTCASDYGLNPCAVVPPPLAAISPPPPFAFAPLPWPEQQPDAPQRYRPVFNIYEDIIIINRGIFT